MDSPKSAPYKDSPKSTPEVLLVPQNLAKPCCIDEKVIKEIFPKPFIIEDSLFKIPNEYILMSDVCVSLDFLEVGKKYRLEKDGHIFNVNVKRKNNCGHRARTFVLLEEINGSDLRGLASFHELDVFDIDDKLVRMGNQKAGQIHPGPVGGQGSSEGYPNAYGIHKPFSFHSSEKINEDPVKLYQAEFLRDESCSINVAVLDTGLLGNINEHKEGTCKDSQTGYNFVDNNFNVRDEHWESHGTRISLIIQHVCKSAKIIPVKIAQNTGVCELYDVLCGLEYARINKARVINASFSFKIDPGKRISLLKTMMNALKKDDIWVIAAAGNAGQYNKDSMGHTPPLGENAPLNLPACYSRDRNKNRVITVTTVSCTRKFKYIHGRSEIRPTDLKVGECYSKKFVDVGAIANGFISPPLIVDDHTFAAPIFPIPEPGTSYATAYITGLVAGILYERGLSTNKKQLVRALSMDHYRKLKNAIRDGSYIEVELPA